LKKKYIEPYDKLNRSITNKTNLDNTIELYEKIKLFKENIKLMRIYEKESGVIESTNSFNCFIKIKKMDIENFEILKEDLEWFKLNEEKMMNSFRNKFHEFIKQMV
jgi:hypothetical protein